MTDGSFCLNNRVLPYSFYRMGHIVLFVSFVSLLTILASSACATIIQSDPEDVHGTCTGGVELWFLNAQSYRKAGLNIENPDNKDYLISGIRMTYNLSDAHNYKAKVIAQRGLLEEDQDAFIEHQITDFGSGDKQNQNFLFTENDHLIVNSDYNIQLRPLKEEHLELQHYDDDDDDDDDESTHSYFWDPDTKDWETEGSSPSSPSLEGKEWAMSALVEPVKPLAANQPLIDSFNPPDAVDGYFADLTLDRTYVFFLEHSPSSNFQVYVYRDRDLLGVPGKMTDETLLASTSGSEPEKKVTWTAEYGGRHYVLVKPVIGSGTYEIEYRENREPMAEAGDDVYANLKFGGSVAVTFYNRLSYDPDDDLNNNGRIDPSEQNNLKYYWDLDSETDTDSDGIFSNDRDASGQKSANTFSKGGKYTVTLTVVDPHGACASDTMDLYLNYIPIVKMDVTVSEDGYAYVGQKLTFSAEGSYDPDDDINGNGIIDGSEVDRLTYSWDFYDAIDKNMDGNRTNDTDASNKMWLMKYPKAGTYNIALNVWDNPEPADRAYNHSRMELEVYYDIDPTEFFVEEFTEEEILSHKDGILNPHDTTFTENDVLIKVSEDESEPAFDVDDFPGANIHGVYVSGENRVLRIELMTNGIITSKPSKDSDDNCAYYIDIVEHPFIESEIDPSNMDKIDIDYLYRFIYHYGELSLLSDIDDGRLFIINFSIDNDGEKLVINIPYIAFLALKEESDENPGLEIDIFATVVYSSSERINGVHTVTVARDAMGRETADYHEDCWSKNGDPPPENPKRPPRKDNIALIVGSSMGGAILIVFVVIIILLKRKKSIKDRGYRDYTIVKPAGTPTGFTVGTGFRTVSDDFRIQNPVARSMQKNSLPQYQWNMNHNR